MQGKGTLWCSDRSQRRLDKLKQRFARAQLFNYRLAPWAKPDHLPTKTRFDGILVDAPCSGVGTWARNPDARWTTGAEDVAELAAVQLGLLNKVAGSLKPGGRLVYAVCTLSRSETTGVAAAFSAAHPELRPLDLAGASQRSGDSTSGMLTLWPQDLDANGMFVAAWQRPS
jgi:16S rRNA (cytosine967-C5)-methyltransferase